MEEEWIQPEPRIYNSPDIRYKMLAIEDAIDVLSGKWRFRIMMALAQGDKHFREIIEWNTGLSDRILSLNLKALMELKMVDKKMSGKTAIYSLSRHGISFCTVIWALCDWGEEHRREIKSFIAGNNQKSQD